MSKMMKAPQIKNLIRGLRDGKKIFNKETNDCFIVDKNMTPIE